MCIRDRLDGLPLKPLWTSVADSPPAVNVPELVAAARNLLAMPTIPATGSRCEFDEWTKKLPGPEVGPVAAEFSWPTYVASQEDPDITEIGENCVNN